jgi:hypothetical protein
MRQVRGQRFPHAGFGSWVRHPLFRRRPFVCARDLAFFKLQLQLVGVEPLRMSAELRALELSDDQVHSFAVRRAHQATPAPRPVSPAYLRGAHRPSRWQAGFDRNPPRQARRLGTSIQFVAALSVEPAAGRNGRVAEFHGGSMPGSISSSMPRPGQGTCFPSEAFPALNDRSSRRFLFVPPMCLSASRLTPADAPPSSFQLRLAAAVIGSNNCMSGRRRSARMEPISNKPMEPMNGTVQLCVTSIT